MMLLLLLHLLILLLPASANQCKLLKPINLSFSSLDMNTTLTWMAPESAEGLFYTVAYSEYGSKIWHRKLGCTNITSTWCNLANETNNYETIYYANVTVSNQNCSISEVSEGFQPRYQTVLGPPKINLFSTATSIVINLTHPIVDHAGCQFKYHIYLDGIHIKETDIPYYKKEHLESHTKYCIAAKLSVFGRESSMSNTTCVTTKSDYISEVTIKLLQYILPVLLAILTLLLLAYAVYKYIYVSNLSQPHILNMISRNSTDAFFFEAYSVPINIIIIGTDMRNLQGTVISGTDKSLNKTYIHFTLPEDDFSNGPDTTDEGNVYDKFQNIAPIASPNISTYDMPH